MTEKEQTFIIDKSLTEMRADLALSKLLSVSRSKAQKLIRSKLVTIDDKAARTGLKLKLGAKLVVKIPEKKILPEPGPLEIIYEDEDVLIINKPAGLVVHPTAKRITGTLVNILINYLPLLKKVGETSRPGIVHRLDRDVSGVMVVAKNQNAYEKLIKEFSQRRIKKIYKAIVFGSMSKDKITITLPLGRTRKGRVVVKAGGVKAITHLSVKKRLKDLTLLEIQTETGLMHQIRTHLKAIGHPILGDTLYAPLKLRRKRKAPRLMLHAQKLIFRHPRTGRVVSFVAPIPKEFDIIKV